jgi:hypothetical protein
MRFAHRLKPFFTIILLEFKHSGPTQFEKSAALLPMVDDPSRPSSVLPQSPPQSSSVVLGNKNNKQTAGVASPPPQNPVKTAASIFPSRVQSPPQVKTVTNSVRLEGNAFENIFRKICRSTQW